MASGYLSCIIDDGIAGVGGMRPLAVEQGVTTAGDSGTAVGGGPSIVTPTTGKAIDIARRVDPAVTAFVPAGASAERTSDHGPVAYALDRPAETAPAGPEQTGRHVDNPGHRAGARKDEGLPVSPASSPAVGPGAGEIPRQDAGETLLQPHRTEAPPVKGGIFDLRGVLALPRADRPDRRTEPRSFPGLDPAPLAPQAVRKAFSISRGWEAIPDNAPVNFHDDKDARLSTVVSRASDRPSAYPTAPGRAAAVPAETIEIASSPAPTTTERRDSTEFNSSRSSRAADRTARVVFAESLAGLPDRLPPVEGAESVVGDRSLPRANEPARRGSLRDAAGSLAAGRDEVLAAPRTNERAPVRLTNVRQDDNGAGRAASQWPSGAAASHVTINRLTVTVRDARATPPPPMQRRPVRPPEPIGDALVRMAPSSILLQAGV